MSALIRKLGMLPVLLGVVLGGPPAVADEATEEELLAGAFVYQQRCALCHGPRGMGDGYLPIQMNDYPDTNLVSKPEARTLPEIRSTIEWGGFRDKHGSDYSPPWVYELSGSDVINVTGFINLMRWDSRRAQNMLLMTSAAAHNAGERIFQTRCAMCHGATGEGNGRLAGVVKAPPPANLLISDLSRNELIRIIDGGGESMGRSPQMPPWGQELGDHLVSSLADYVIKLREAADEAD